jgi:hypothetical protein
MMKKTILIGILSLLSALTVEARSLVVVLTDSTKIYFLLDDKPVMRLESDMVWIDTQSFSIDHVDRFYISQTDDPSGIEAIMAERKMQMNGSTLVIAGNEEVTLYGVNGTKVKARVSKVADMTSVDTSDLPKGPYVVKIGKASFKFIKK